jgi:two-component system, sensor histidine kinase PdtaS|uniref:sensor histidine kinase n=1 Tax=Candidatus Planktophila sp. TaxID=2175601 RepID=UPI00404AFAB0
MPKLEEFLRDRSPLDAKQIRRIRELTGDWQLLADLSFADLILWVPLRKDFKSWPSGYVAVAHIRPTTAATVFNQDVIGDEIAWGARPRIDQALSEAEIIRDAQPEKFGEIFIKEETIPVILDDQVIAIISRHRNAELMRQPSRLELNYREVAHNVYRMVAEGTFPYTEHSELFDPAVRVGDGLIRLDINGAIIYASPNAKSAFSRMGWTGELEGNNLGAAARRVSVVKLEAHEEAIEVGLSGKALRRVEIENAGGTVDLLALPLLAGGDRIGAIVLLQNVTELRRRERELVTKDATIREIHHRVKNNLQTVSALLRLQSRRIEDPAASAALNEAVRRIASIALVHETLSSSAEASVAFDDVLDRLVAHALDLSPRMGQLQISRMGELGALDPRIATPLSLVVTELIHNALEHGLAESGNHLTITVARSQSGAEITIFDDGVGLPKGFSLTESSNLGLQIVRTLAENELRGNIDLVRTPSGTEARLTFPI